MQPQRVRGSGEQAVLLSLLWSSAVLISPNRSLPLEDNTETRVSLAEKHPLALIGMSWDLELPVPLIRARCSPHYSQQTAISVRAG